MNSNISFCNEIEAYLIRQKIQFAAIEIQHGVQFRFGDGAILNSFKSGKVNGGGRIAVRVCACTRRGRMGKAGAPNRCSPSGFPEVGSRVPRLRLAIGAICKSQAVESGAVGSTTL